MLEKRSRNVFKNIKRNKDMKKINYKEHYRCAPWHDRKHLEYYYNECGYSMAEIGKFYSVSKQTILRWMKKFNIDRRGFGATWSKYNHKKYRNRFYLHQQYVTLGLSTITIARNLGCCKSIIPRWLIKFNIPRRRKGRHKGIKNE